MFSLLSTPTIFSNSLSPNFKTGSFMKFSLISSVNSPLVYRKLPWSYWLETSQNYYNSGSQETKMCINGLMSRGHQGCVPFWRLKVEDQFPALFHLPEVACSPCLVVPPLPSKQSNLCHNAIFLFLTLLPPLPPFKDLCDYHGSTQIIMDNAFILRPAD